MLNDVSFRLGEAVEEVEDLPLVASRDPSSRISERVQHRIVGVVPVSNHSVEVAEDDAHSASTYSTTALQFSEMS